MRCEVKVREYKVNGIQIGETNNITLTHHVPSVTNYHMVNLVGKKTLQ